MSLPNELLPVGLLGTGTGAEYEISRSLRFNSSDSAYLSKSFASAGNRKTWTFAFWYKKVKNSQAGFESILGISTGGSTYFTLRFGGSGGAADCLTVEDYPSYVGNTLSVFRDPSAWYHFVIAVDTTQSTSSERVKVYVNGVLQQLSAQPSQNFDFLLNTANRTDIGNLGSTYSNYYLNGYLADVHFIDGQALTPSSFTEVSATTGQLVPIAYTGTYGTNGFHLPFSDNSTAAALGTDTSGNSNTWTVNNISVGFPVTQNYSTTTTGTAPTPYLSTSYYALAFDGDTSTSFSWTTGTWAMDWTSLPSAVTVSSSLRVFCYPRLGTLTVNINGSNVASITGNSVDWRTISFTGTINTISFTGTDTYAGVYAIEVDGAILIDPRANSVNDSLVDTPTSYGTDTAGAGGEVRGNYATLNPLTSSAAFTLTNGNLDVSDTGAASPVLLGSIGVNSGKWYWEVTLGNQYTYVGAAQVTSRSSVGYLGASAGQFMYNPSAVNFCYVNGVQYNYSTASTATTGDVIGVALDFDSNVITFYKNGVSQGAFSSNVLGTSTWAPAFKSNSATSAIFNFGQRPFAHPAPSGYKALCDTNLPAPDPEVAQPSTVMDVALDSGANILTATKALCGGNANFLWIKDRVNGSTNHHLIDIVRDPQLDGTPFLASNSTSDETTLGTYSAPSGNSVGWGWYAGSSNTTYGPIGSGADVEGAQYSITSSVRANPTAGFSIVTYTGTLSSVGNNTVGHGLNVAPKLVIYKNRDASQNWHVVMPDFMTNTQYLNLNSTSGLLSYGSGSLPDPTSSVFSTLYSSETDVNGNKFVAYCFAPVDGYSSFGSYTGNGSADGPFVYTGMRPRWILFKRTDTANSWFILDTARDSYNALTDYLAANLSDAEGTSANIADALSNGFKVRGGSTYYGFNASGGTYIYAAFAEHPFKTSRAR